MAPQALNAAEQALPVTPLHDFPMHMTLNEDFGDWPKQSAWTAEIGFGSNPAIEAEAYTPDFVTRLSGGGIRLTADKKPLMGKQISAGGLMSLGGFAQTFGHFEIKAKAPKGAGTWPAFWLLPADQSWPPEIDVFEYLGRNPNSMVFSVHWNNNAGVHEFISKEYVGEDFSRDFHVYAVDWRPDLLVWSIDSVERARVTANVPAKKMYLIANIAIGSGGWPGPIDPQTNFPANFDIAYIRAFQFDDLPAEKPVCMEYGKASFDRPRVRPGEAVTVRGSLKIGDEELKQLHLHVFLTGFGGRELSSGKIVDFTDIHPGSTLTYQVELDIPKNRSDAAYGVGLSASSSNCKISIKTADSIVVSQ